jgi:hypothetical protein
MPVQRFDEALGFGLLGKHPVHQMITAEALRKAHMLGGKKGTEGTYKSPQAQEYSRGVMWNDDPLMQQVEPDKFAPNYGGTIDFLHNFFNYGHEASDRSKNQKPGFGPQDNMVARTHYGDLQFIHGMAANDKEKPEETKRKMMMWAEFTSKIAKGDIAGDASFANLGKGKDLNSKEDDDPELLEIAKLFPQMKGKSINDLFGVKNGKGDVKQRAMGSLLHMVQDSYAGGHSEREPGDGKVKSFHSYTNQDHEAHAHSDARGEGKTVGDQLMNTPGAVTATNKSAELLMRVEDGKSWEDIQEYLDKDVFALADNTTPAGTGEKYKKEDKPWYKEAWSGLTDWATESAVDYMYQLKEDPLRAGLTTGGAAVGAGIGGGLGGPIGGLIGGALGGYATNKALQWLGGDTNFTNSAISGAKDLYHAGGKAWDATKGGVSDAWDWTKDKAGEAWDWTKDAANTVGDAASSAWDWAKGLASDAWDWTKGTANKVGDAASDAWDWTKEKGNQAWDATKKGTNLVGDMASQGWDAAKQGASKAWDWADNMFDVDFLDHYGDIGSWKDEEGGKRWGGRVGGTGAGVDINKHNPLTDKGGSLSGHLDLLSGFSELSLGENGFTIGLGGGLLGGNVDYGYSAGGITSKSNHDEYGHFGPSPEYEGGKKGQPGKHHKSSSGGHNSRGGGRSKPGSVSGKLDLLWGDPDHDGYRNFGLDLDFMGLQGGFTTEDPLRTFAKLNGGNALLDYAPGNMTHDAIDGTKRAVSNAYDTARSGVSNAYNKVSSAASDAYDWLTDW